MFDGASSPPGDAGQRKQRERFPAAKPTLQIISSNLPETASAACALLARQGRHFSMHGTLVEIVLGNGVEIPQVRIVDHHAVTVALHRYCTPVRMNAKGEEIPDTFPERAARMILAMVVDKFPEFYGFCSSPKLLTGGGIEIVQGYDPASGRYYHNVPNLRVVTRPTRRDAEGALAILRWLLRTFCFADAIRDATGFVDQDKPPGFDESAAIIALIGAILRPSLDFAPGVLVTAPALNGSGAGKGLLVRLICTVAYGALPTTINASPKPGEFDNRIASALMQATPGLLIDNINGAVPVSDLLASIFTEPIVSCRILGFSKLVRLLTVVSIFFTGNATRLQEDTLRRFYACHLDPRVEDAEAREFPPGILDDARNQRAEYLSAALTIWRWAQQNSGELQRGLPLGTFERWCEQCRDPILNLGGADPVAKARAAKQDDPRRSEWAETLRIWFEQHGSATVTIKELHESVWQRITTPQQQTPQYARRRLEEKLNTRAGGLILMSSKTAKWSDTKYSVHEQGEEPRPVLPEQPTVAATNQRREWPRRVLPGTRRRIEEAQADDARKELRR